MCLEYLSPPSPKLSGTAGHSRSVSHDSYFDHLAESTPMHSTLRPDDDGKTIFLYIMIFVICLSHWCFIAGLSDLKWNFDLDESEMKIFSEESSQLFSNTSSSEQLQVGYHVCIIVYDYLEKRIFWVSQLLSVALLHSSNTSCIDVEFLSKLFYSFLRIPHNNLRNTWKEKRALFRIFSKKYWQVKNLVQTNCK